MKIKTQFTITMTLFGIILVAVATTTIIVNQRIEKANEQEKIAGNIAQGASELSYLANDYLIYRESQQLGRWQSKFDSFSSQVSRLKVDRPEQQALVQNIRANQQRLNEVFDSTVSAVGTLFPNQKVTLEVPLFQVSWSRIAIQGQALVSDASRLSQLLRQQMDQFIQMKTQLMYALLGLLGLFFLSSYMLTQQRILKSITALHAGTAVIGSGNLDFKIQEGKDDEIGDLSRAFNHMTANLKTVTASKADLEREIAERQQAAEALRQSEEQVRRQLTEIETIYDSAHIGLCVFDRQLRYVRINNLLAEINGVPAEQHVGKTPREVVPGLADTAEQLAERIFRTGEPALDVEFSGTTQSQPGIQRFWIEQWLPLKNQKDEVIGINVVVEEVTERKQAEEALREAYDELDKRVQERTSELSESIERLRAENIARRQLEDTLRQSEYQVRFFASQCLTAQETERKRVAGELHDSIAASLGAMRFRIDKIAEEMKQGHGSPEALQDLGSKVMDINNEVRRIMADLRPSILDDLGIIAAMNWFCREYEKTYSHISVEKEIGISEEEVPDSLKTAIFRISQEAMNNISKYSKASLVNLSLRKEDAKIQLTIQDNGQGFDLDTTKRGMGLSTMKERAQLSGGSFDLESAVGKGTVIRVSWPC